MKLAQAIDKREKLLKKLQDIEQWKLEQQFGAKKLVWREVNIAIENVISLGYEEYHKLNDAINKAIEGIEIDGK